MKSNSFILKDQIVVIKKGHVEEFGLHYKYWYFESNSRVHFSSPRTGNCDVMIKKKRIGNVFTVYAINSTCNQSIYCQKRRKNVEKRENASKLNRI